jgi:hypothetical protein
MVTCASLGERNGAIGAIAQRIAPPERLPHPEECRRPLYLGMRLKARVDVDGLALRVRSATRAEARYPLSRVSRVIASARVQWSAEALEACLEAGIPVVIMAPNGAPLGLVHPACVRASRFSEDMDEFLDRPDWRAIYENWLRAARMRILREWRAGRDAAGNPLGPREYGEIVRKLVYGPADASPFEGETGVWRAALHALASVALRGAGLQPVSWGAGGTVLNLLEDLTRLLELRLRLEVRGEMEHGFAGEAVVLKVFHAISERLEVEAGRILVSLARRVKQVLSEWH